MKEVYTGYQTQKKNILLSFSVRERGEVYTGYQTQKKNILLFFSVRDGSLLYSVNLSAEFAHATSVHVHPACAFSWLLSHHGY